MPLPIFILAAAPVVVDAAATTIWLCVGGSVAGAGGVGGVYYFRDRIYRWWYSNSYIELTKDDPINKQLNTITSIKKSLEKTNERIEQISEAKMTILDEVNQESEKIDQLVIQVKNINVHKKETFESLLKKITDGTGDKLENVLTGLEKIKKTLTLDQVKIIQLVIETLKENQALREVNQRQGRIIVRLDKINSILQQKILSFDNSLEEQESNSITYKKD